MQELLTKMLGRKVDVFCCGAASLSGEIIRVEGGILYLKDDEQQMCFVAIDKIAVVWETRDEDKRAGFVSLPPNNR